MAAGDDIAREKQQVRRRLLVARAERSVTKRAAAADAIARRLVAVVDEQVASRGRPDEPVAVAAYSATAGEPDLNPALGTISALGVDVWLPVLGADNVLDWAAHAPGDALATGRFGIAEPVSDRLGADAIARAAVIVCPGLAGDPTGRRLGRGGGSYDRALSQASRRALRVLVLFDDEVLEQVPTDDHDEPVHVIVTPSRTLRVGGDGR